MYIHIYVTFRVFGFISKVFGFEFLASLLSNAITFTLGYHFTLGNHFTLGYRFTLDLLHPYLSPGHHTVASGWRRSSSLSTKEETKG